jgi:hypothetical protein
MTRRKRPNSAWLTVTSFRWPEPVFTGPAATAERANRRCVQGTGRAPFHDRCVERESVRASLHRRPIPGIAAA